MKLLVDNTLIHRLGRVVESKPSEAISASDAIAFFHFIEHSLFADQIIVSKFQPESVVDRTTSILASLAQYGLVDAQIGAGGGLAVVHESFNSEEVAFACQNASWHILGELTTLEHRGLKKLGKLADESSRPDNCRDEFKLFNRLAGSRATLFDELSLDHPAVGGSATERHSGHSPYIAINGECPE